MESPREVTIVEAGFREAVQKASRPVTADEFLPIVQKCVDAGYQVIELGTLKHDGYKSKTQAVAEQLFPLAAKKVRRPEGVLFQAIIGGCVEDVEMAADHGADCVTLLSGGSDFFLSQLLGGAPGGYQKVMKRFDSCVAAARRRKLRVNGAISFPFFSEWEGEIPYERVAGVVQTYLDAGVTELSLSDTHGMSNPVFTYDRTRRLMADFPEATWFSHVHNTRGTGLTNAWASYQAGVRKFDASFAGAGGCPYFVGSTGNVASEDLVYFFEACGVSTGIRQDLALQIAQAIEDLNFNTTESYALRFDKIRRNMSR